MIIDIELAADAEKKEKPDNPLSLAFGTVFTDHMFTMEYTNGEWHDPRIIPYKPLSLDPAALCLHYGQGIFEGMKAYRNRGRILLFRPEKNIERLNVSAERMVMPRIDPDFALSALSGLLKIEQDWIPEIKGTSLYIRPTLIATEPKLGVRPSQDYLFYIILSPVGPYFADGFGPVKIMLAEQHVRAVDGGVGAAKTMGNYGASLYSWSEAKKAGYSQVLWLDAHERKFIEEVGTMNIFVKFDDEIATPPLTGTILPGITRDSVIHMTRDWGFNVNERRISIDELWEGIRSGKVEEVFGAGTAAIIAPVGTLAYKDTAHSVANGNIGNLTQRLYDELTGIQSGDREDKYGWVFEVN
ncbi:MAG: branched-chain amino acid aminotransferase [Candidatus Thorarchaeota archaeon]|jgi:branched-chain amino acid aminotransferase